MGGRSGAGRAAESGRAERGPAPAPHFRFHPRAAPRWPRPPRARGNLETAFPKALHSLRLHLHGNQRGEVTVAGPRLQLQWKSCSHRCIAPRCAYTAVPTRKGWKSCTRNSKCNPIKLSLHIIVQLGLPNKNVFVQSVVFSCIIYA